MKYCVSEEEVKSVTGVCVCVCVCEGGGDILKYAWVVKSASAHQWPVSKHYIQVTRSCRLIIAVVLMASSLNEFTEVVTGFRLKGNIGEWSSPCVHRRVQVNLARRIARPHSLYLEMRERANCRPASLFNSTSPPGLCSQVGDSQGVVYEGGGMKVVVVVGGGGGSSGLSQGLWQGIIIIFIGGIPLHLWDHDAPVELF